MKPILRLSLALLSLFFFFGCERSGSDIVSETDIARYMKELQDNEAVALFKIDNKPFYTEEMEPFGIRIHASFASLRGDLMSKEGAKLFFDFARLDWYTQKPVEFNLISSSSGLYKDRGKFMLGKQFSQAGENFEGYNFVDGKFKVIRFDEEQFVAVLEGQVVNPGDADIPENMKPIKGYIIAKKPPMTFESIEKEQIFYPQ